jgi:competence protein ComEA
VFAGAALALGAFLWFRPSAMPSAAATSADGWTAPSPAARASPGRRATEAALVYVAGEVRRPGVYRVRPQDRVGDAVTLAGGLRPDADPVAVNLAAHLSDGDEIVVAARGAAPSRPHSRRIVGPHRRTKRGPPRHGAAPPASVVDLNRADADTLATLPGVGPGLAERIVAFRTANGPFASPDELLDVSGFTDRRLDAVLPYVTAR